MKERTRLILACVLSGLAACGVGRTHLVEGSYGRVTASSEVEASAIAALFDGLVPCVRAGREGFRNTPYHVLIQPDGELPEVYAAYAGVVTESGHIMLQLRGRTPAEIRHTAVHELVHHEQGDAWALMPTFVREGLADVVADACAPEWAAQDTARHLGWVLRSRKTPILLEWDGPDGEAHDLSLEISAMLVTGRLASSRIWSATAPDAAAGNWVFDGIDRGIGYLIADELVDRYSWAGVHALLESARSNGERVVDVRRALWPDGMVTEERLMALVEARLGKAELAGVLDIMLRNFTFHSPPFSPWPDDTTIEGFVRLARPRVGLAVSPTRIPMTDVPQFILER